MNKIIFSLIMLLIFAVSSIITFMLFEAGIQILDIIFKI